MLRRLDTALSILKMSVREDQSNLIKTCALTCWEADGNVPEWYSGSTSLPSNHTAPSVWT